MQMKYLRKIFWTPFSDLKKFQGPLFSMKIMSKPHRKHVNSIFLENLWQFFPRPPLRGQKFLRAPFLHQPTS